MPTSPRRPHPSWPLILAAGLLTACAAGPEPGRPYHAFELGLERGAGTLAHLRWHYGDLAPGEKPQAVATGIPFVLRRQTMPVPALFEASWQAADGGWRRVQLPVRDRLRQGVAGHRVMVWITADGARGEFVTYTPRGDLREPFAEVPATPVTAEEAAAVSR